jgi:chorismate--pyruvate lyase
VNALGYAIISAVKTYSTSTQVRLPWLNKPLAAGRDHAWLIHRDSLTARLQQRYAQFSVQTLCMQQARIQHDESAQLNLRPHQLSTVRDVMLLGNKQAVVFAHSVIPARAKRGAWHHLTRLGNQPLGALLFANPQIQRTPFRYKKLSRHHCLYQKAAKHFECTPAYLWARRSVFYLNCVSILVTEIFLPTLHD